MFLFLQLPGPLRFNGGVVDQFLTGTWNFAGAG